MDSPDTALSVMPDPNISTPKVAQSVADAAPAVIVEAVSPEFLVETAIAVVGLLYAPPNLAV